MRSRKRYKYIYLYIYIDVCQKWYEERANMMSINDHSVRKSTHKWFRINGPNGVLLMNPYYIARSLVRLYTRTYTHHITCVLIVCVIWYNKIYMAHRLNMLNAQWLSTVLSPFIHHTLYIHKYKCVCVNELFKEWSETIRNESKRQDKTKQAKRVCKRCRSYAQCKWKWKKKKRPHSYVTQSAVQESAAAAAAAVTAALEAATINIMNI